MEHLGDITKISGSAVLPVNVIIGGSPCQDLSIAGNRAGLAGERSGLFMEQLRIIKEMRKADEDRGKTGSGVRPRFMVWENVPGAFSSNKGADFGAVLQETARIVCEKAPAIPVPKGGWPTSGCLQIPYVGGKCSIAWRVFDAQFWGVPQRRRRIALIADFGGGTASEILFEREGVSGDPETGGETGETVAANAENGIAGNDQLLAESDGCLTLWDVQSRRIYSKNGIWPSLYGGEGHGYVVDNQIREKCGAFNGHKSVAASIQYSEDHAPTIEANMPPDVWTQTYCIQGNCIDRADTARCNGRGWTEDVSYTLNTIDRPAVAFSFDSLASNSMKSNNPNSGCREVSVSKTLDASRPDPAKNQGGIAIVEKVGIPLLNDQGGRSISGEDSADVAPTLRAEMHGNVPAVAVAGFKYKQGAKAHGIAYEEGKSPTLSAGQPDASVVYAIENHPQDSRIKLSEGNIVQTLNGKMGTGGGNTPMVLECYSEYNYDGYNESDKAAPLKNAGGNCGGGSENLVAQSPITDPQGFQMNGFGDYKMSETANTMRAAHDVNTSTLCACKPQEMNHYIVRRLTPLECERLQGYPDGWTDIGAWDDTKGKVHKSSTDSA